MRARDARSSSTLACSSALSCSFSALSTVVISSAFDAGAQQAEQEGEGQAGEDDHRGDVGDAFDRLGLPGWIASWTRRIRKARPPVKTTGLRACRRLASLHHQREDDHHRDRDQDDRHRLRLAGAAEADLLYLHHLTPLNEAAARAFPGRAGPRPRPRHRAADARTDRRRARRRAGPTPRSGRSGCASGRRPASGSWSATAGGLERAAAVLDLDPERFVCVPNGFDPSFAPGPIDRARPLAPRPGRAPPGLAAGLEPGSVAYEEADLAALAGTVLLYVGRFTEVKRLPLLIEAFARPRPRFAGPRVPGPGRRPPRRVGGRASVRDDRAPRRSPTSSSPAGTPTTTCPTSCAPPTSSSTPRSTSSSARSWSRRWPASCRRSPSTAPARPTIVDDPDTGWLVAPDDAEALAARWSPPSTIPRNAAARPPRPRRGGRPLRLAGNRRRSHRPGQGDLLRSDLSRGKGRGQKMRSLAS